MTDRSFQGRAALIALICLLVAPAALAQGAAAPDVTFTVLPAQSAFHPGTTARFVVRAQLTPGWHMNAHKPLDEYLIPTELTLTPPDGVTVQEIVYPMPQTITLAFSPDPLAVYEHTFDLGVALTLPGALPPGIYTIPGNFRYQACNDTQCRPPVEKKVSITLTVVDTGQTVTPQNQDALKGIAFTGSAASGQPTPPAATTEEPPTADTTTQATEQDWRTLAEDFNLVGSASGYLDNAEFIHFIDIAETGEQPVGVSTFAGKSPLVIILLTLLGGLLLNLTPCVLPMIPINIAVIGAGAAGARGRGIALGTVYGLAIAIVYGLLGAFIVVTTGTFGSLNASPWFNAAIAVIFVALALAMFDVWSLDLSRYQAHIGLRKNPKGSFWVAFFMGGVAALLAGACVAPVVIAVVLFSRDLYAQGNVLGLLLPFCLGLGMAIPWPFAGAGLSLFKPGKWMVRVKQAFGVFILVLAAYYAYLAYELVQEQSPAEPSAVAASAEEAGWNASLAEGLAQAKAENKMVLIDFWATWCKNCLVMNETTFKDPAVIQRIEPYIKIKYQAEAPTRSPAKEVMDYFGVIGLPTYIVLEPKTSS